MGLLDLNFAGVAVGDPLWQIYQPLKKFLLENFFEDKNPSKWAFIHQSDSEHCSSQWNPGNATYVVGPAVYWFIHGSWLKAGGSFTSVKSRLNELCKKRPGSYGILLMTGQQAQQFVTEAFADQILDKMLSGGHCHPEHQAYLRMCISLQVVEAGYACKYDCVTTTILEFLTRKRSDRVKEAMKVPEFNEVALKWMRELNTDSPDFKVHVALTWITLTDYLYRLSEDSDFLQHWLKFPQLDFVNLHLVKEVLPRHLGSWKNCVERAPRATDTLDPILDRINRAGSEDEVLAAIKPIKMGKAKNNLEQGQDQEQDEEQDKDQDQHDEDEDSEYDPTEDMLDDDMDTEDDDVEEDQDDAKYDDVVYQRPKPGPWGDGARQLIGDYLAKEDARKSFFMIERISIIKMRQNREHEKWWEKTMDTDSEVTFRFKKKFSLSLVKARKTGHLVVVIRSWFKMMAEPEGGVGSGDADVDLRFSTATSFKDFMYLMKEIGMLSEEETTRLRSVLESFLMNLEDYNYSFARKVALPEGFFTCKAKAGIHMVASWMSLRLYDFMYIYAKLKPDKRELLLQAHGLPTDDLSNGIPECEGFPAINGWPAIKCSKGSRSSVLTITTVSHQGGRKLGHYCCRDCYVKLRKRQRKRGSANS